MNPDEIKDILTGYGLVVKYVVIPGVVLGIVLHLLLHATCS
jgi:hypothetical protein